MNLRQSFIDHVKEYFSFLRDEYYFTFIAPRSDSSVEAVRFEKTPVYIEIGWYKGEIDVMIGVSIETAVLRPYTSRLFSLKEISVHLDPGALHDAPIFSDYITREDEMMTELKFQSEIMRKYCSEILHGDINILEEMSVKRS